MAKAIKQILFDHEIFRRQQFGGISRYFAELISGINAQPGYKASPRKFASNNTYLQEKGLNSVVNPLGNNDILRKAYWKLENRRLYKSLKKGSFDVFHPTYYSPYFLQHLKPGKPFVLTVHDMIHENYLNVRNEYYGEETNGKIELIPKAAHIIAVSHYTKGQIIRHFPGIHPDKISVIYHGPNLKPELSPDAAELDLPEKYILFTGLRKYYKNFFWLADVLRDYLKSTNIKLVCAGGHDLDAFERRFLAEKQLEDHVIYRHFSNDGQLKAIFKNAVCFIFPSTEEGFGMPILEAFASECPVILANCSCFPEIAQDAALYFEPGDQKQLIKHIETVQENKLIRPGLIGKGKTRLSAFSWEGTVAEHIKIYDEVISN